MLGYFLCQIIKNASLPSFKITPDIGRTMEYIIEHLDEEIPIEELAQIALLSVSRFKQKFKDQMGTSPRNFINYNKIEEAKRKLQENGNVTQTAMELGFSSSNYFSSVFRKFTSTSPSEYLKQLSDDRNSLPEETVPEETQQKGPFLQPVPGVSAKLWPVSSRRLRAPYASPARNRIFWLLRRLPLETAC